MNCSQGRVQKPLHRVRREIVILPMFVRRPSRPESPWLKPIKDLSNRIFIKKERGQDRRCRSL